VAQVSLDTTANKLTELNRHVIASALMAITNTHRFFIMQLVTDPFRDCLTKPPVINVTTKRVLDDSISVVNLLAPDFFFNLAHPVYKM